MTISAAELINLASSSSLPVRGIMLFLAALSALSWLVFLAKSLELWGINARSTRFLEAFRESRSISEINRISVEDDFAGNPLADIAAVATDEIQLSQQAGLAIAGEHRGTTLLRSQNAMRAVLLSLKRRLSGGLGRLSFVFWAALLAGTGGALFILLQMFLAPAGANTAVAGFDAHLAAQAVLVMLLGLLVAIPARFISGLLDRAAANYAVRSEQFSIELMAALSRQLDKGV